MGLGKIIDTIIYENIGGAFIHGFTLPYFMASDVPRLVRNWKNTEYPEDISNSDYTKYHEEHIEPGHRLDARLFGGILSFYVALGIVQMTDVTALEMGGFMLATNLAALAYAEVPVVKKVVNETWNLSVNAVNALGRYCI